MTIATPYENKPDILPPKQAVLNWRCFVQDVIDYDPRYTEEIMKDILKKLNCKKVDDVSFKALVAFSDDGRLDRYLAPLAEIKVTPAAVKTVASEWDYPCPICGAPTTRNHKVDGMYRHEDVGWTCSVSGSLHFHQTAWGKLKPFRKFVPESVASAGTRST